MVTLEAFLDSHICNFFNIYPELEKYKKEILFIYAGANSNFHFLNYTYQRLIGDILKSIKLGKKKIVFLNLDETIFSKDIDKVHQVLNHVNFKFENAFYVCSGLNAEEGYKDYCVRNNLDKKINIISVSVFDTVVSNELNLDYKIEKKEKLFLCFNRVARNHRLILLSRIVKNNLLDKCFYSFMEHINSEQMSQIIIPEESQLIFKKNRIKLPIHLNRTAETNPVDVYSDDAKYYENSYFSLVTETLFFNSLDERNLVTKINSKFISEKIFKPLAAKHPFILVGQPHILKHMRSLGYKTFHPLFDERYDDIEDDDQRMDAIEKELVRVSSFDDRKWTKVQTFLKPIVEHNSRLYFERYKSPRNIFRITDNIEHLFAN